MTSRGIYDDGWVGRSAHVMVQGGGPTDLVLRAHVLPCPDQHLEIRVNGDVIASRAIAPGPLELRLPIAASESERRIELDWKETTQPNDGDARQAAALVTFLNVTTDRLPSGLRIPGGLAHPGARVSGIYPDGWAEGQSRVELASGDAAELVIRGAVPDALRDQTLEVVVAGMPVFAGPVPPGAFDIRIAVDRTDDARNVELRWSAVSAISDVDRREAAALLSFIGVASGPAPTSIGRFPTDLADPNVRHNGIYSDGWLEAEASVTLAGGPAAELVIRAEIPSAIEKQRLEVRIGQATIGSAVADDHAINLRLPVEASANDRDIVLAWVHQAVLSQSDTRSVAAHLTLLAIAAGQPPNAIARFPSDLMDPNLVSSGFYYDGWSALQAMVVLAGVAAADLVIRARISASLPEQDLDVEVDGRKLAFARATRGMIDIRVPLPLSDSPRRIVLRWGMAASVSEADRRPAAALVDMIAIVPRTSI